MKHHEVNEAPFFITKSPITHALGCAALVTGTVAAIH